MVKRLRDARILHGHRVISGPELRETFGAAGDPDDPVRVRRRVVHGVVLVLLLGLIAGGIITALAIINGRLQVPAPAASEAPQSACPAAVFDYVPPEKITINVFNSTSRPGLARTVADELLGRKFVVGTVSNTEPGYRGVAAVVSGAAGQSAAFTVQRNVPDSDYFQDGRTDASVDVILAGDFKELTAADRVDLTPGKLSCPRESRRIADDAKWPVIPTATPTP
jgi:hypothetical protein